MICINVSIIFTYFPKHWLVNTNATFEVLLVTSGLDLAARYSQKCEWVFQIFPFLRVIKSITRKFLRVDLIWKTCSLFCHFIFLLVAFSILLVKIYATSKKLLVAKKIVGRPLHLLILDGTAGCRYFELCNKMW